MATAAVNVSSFAEVFVSWLLFDSIHRSNHQLVAPSASIITSSVAPPRMYQRQDGIVGEGRRATSSDGVPSSLAATITTSRGAAEIIWTLPNGRVQFDCPLSFAGLSVRNGEITSDPIFLWDPKLLGSGGSGAVFSFSTRNNYDSISLLSTQNVNKQTLFDINDRIAIKVSWKKSRASVEKECEILQSLDSVPHIVRCLGRPNAYPYEDGRVMIALSPIVTSDMTSSINNLKPGTAQINAVKCTVEAMIGMLQTGVFTIDVQPLIDRHSGEVVFIDFTEANHYSYPITPMDESALVGFCSEMLALIPDSLIEVAEQLLKQKLRSSSDELMPPLPEKVVDILERIWLE